MRRNRVLTIAIAAILTALVACFGTKAVDLGSSSDRGFAVASGSGYIYPNVADAPAWSLAESRGGRDRHNDAGACSWISPLGSHHA